MGNDQILKGLETDARLVRERILTVVKEEKAKQAAADLNGFMEEHGWKQKNVADKLGVSTAQIKQFLQNKYKGKTDDLINKVVHLIDSFARKDRRVKGKAFIETTTAKKIGMLIAQTEAFSNEEEGKIGLIVGDGGHGKSCCMRQYAQANKNTIYVELDDAMTTTLIFEEIAEKIGDRMGGSLATITRRLIDNLQNRHIIVMLDEASSLKVKQFNLLRQVIVIKSRCPLILAGNHNLFETIMQDTKRQGYESLDQFTSRLMCILDLDDAANSEDKDGGGGLYTPEDIRELYQYGGIRLTSDGVSALRRICRTPRSGRLRTCSLIIGAIHTAGISRQSGQIDSEMICRTIRELDLPVRARLPMATGTLADDETKEEVQAMTA